MTSRDRRSLSLLALLSSLPAVLLLAMPPGEARPAALPASEVSGELARLFEEDQGDRSSEAIDWVAIVRRDAVRLARVKELYAGGRLRSGADYYRAAMILQHSTAVADYLLAHELSVVALGLGEVRAGWLAAAAEDRFLMNLGRPQRFGTQYRSVGEGPLRLYPVDRAVTDSLRAALGVPALADARRREGEMNQRTPHGSPPARSSP
jgi:hypothetical protein